uniref:Integrator complex subunit 5 N-terminal domain-containing protein n=1 Tax=Amphimedon queenslandica TaxID=400682 RepID=A0A1X7THM1_AMPQE
MAAARKSHSIVSNLQTLLHHDSEAPGPHYLSKKLETVLICLPTVPMLRGVALEVLSSCFKYLSQFKGHEQSSKPPLSSLVHSTCEVLYSLLTHSPSGWSHTLLQWGVVNLARLSVLYNVDSLPKEGVVNFMMSQDSVPFLVKFVEEGIHYKHSNEETDIINLFINISQKESANIGWLLSYIIMENSSLFSEGSLMDGCVLTTPLLPSILNTLSSCFDRLSRTHPLIVSHTLLGMVKRVLDEDAPTKSNVVGVARGGASSVYLQVVLEMMLQSHSILDLVITDVIKLITPEVILSLVCSELERGTNEEKEEGEEEMETDQDSPLLSSLSSLLLQLSHDRAVVAINLLLSSLNYYSLSSGDKVGGAEEEEEEEDGEINTLSLAKGQLLEAVKQLLNSVLSVCKKGVSFLLFSSNEDEPSPGNKKPVNAFSPIQYIISIQSGLPEWVELVIKSPDNHWLIQLVESVGMTSSEISGATVLNTLLSSTNNSKLSSLVDHLFKRYRLRHPSIAQSLITQGVTTGLMKENGNETIKKWSINLLTLARNNESCFQGALLSSFNSLLLLLPLSSPLSSIHILSLLETVSARMARESQLSTSLSAAGILINYYLKTLGDLSIAIMNDAPILYEYEQLLNKIRSLLSHLSSGNSLIEVFICSNILRTITSEVSTLLTVGRVL